MNWGVALAPHQPGTYIVLWTGRCVCPYRPTYVDSKCLFLKCKACCWNRGTYRGENYIQDPQSRWWERDSGMCHCLAFDRFATCLRRDVRFLVEGSLDVHVVDHIGRGPVCVVDDDDIRFSLCYVIALPSLHRIHIGEVWRSRAFQYWSPNTFLRFKEWR